MKNPLKSKRIIKETVEGCKVLSLILGAPTDFYDTADDSFILPSTCIILLITTLYAGLSDVILSEANLFLIWFCFILFEY